MATITIGIVSGSLTGSKTFIISDADIARIIAMQDAQPVVSDAMIAAGAIAYNGGVLKIGLKARLRAAYLAMQAAQLDHLANASR